MTTPEYHDAEGRTFSEFVADQVLGAIVAHGRSIRSVAAEAGIAHTTLGDKFNGRSAFNTDQLSRVAQVLEMHPAEFVTGPSFVIDPA